MGRAVRPNSYRFFLPVVRGLREGGYNGPSRIFDFDFWPEKVKNVKAAGFWDFRLKIVDASLRFRRRFSGFSILEFLVNKIVFFLTCAIFKFSFDGSICWNVRFRNFRSKIDDASLRFRCCFPKFAFFTFFFNKMCFFGMRNFENYDFCCARAQS